jgi:hypothetical protein
MFSSKLEVLDHLVKNNLIKKYTLDEDYGFYAKILTLTFPDDSTITIELETESDTFGNKSSSLNIY